MTTHTITKSTILSAVKTEPLTSGRWMSSKDQDECRVCAVGAIIRQLGMYKEPEWFEQLTNYHYGVGDSNNTDFNMFSRLSIFWETLVEESLQNHDILNNVEIKNWDDYDRMNDYRVDLSEVSVESQVAIVKYLRPKLVAWVEKNVPDDFNHQLT